MNKSDLNIFKNEDLTKHLIESISEISKNLDDVCLMEVCGTHTMSIARYGIKNLLPSNIHLLSGPGCPVCVTPNSEIDKMIAICDFNNVIVTTFGDMIRVPGSSCSLMEKQSEGADVRVVYSALDALDIAKDNPNKEIVHCGVGFETTTPTTGLVIQQAKNENIMNFSVMCFHKNMPHALEFIASKSSVNVDGLLLPGHVSTISGLQIYQFLAEKYNMPGVVAGFEVVDILQAILLILKQIESGKSYIENAYSRVVKNSGNCIAQSVINKVFSVSDTFWRGFGLIKKSGFSINDNYKKYDAESKFNITPEKTIDHKGCKCGEILQGILKPSECPLYKKICNPQNPIGPCMVSSEGSCAAFYKYEI